MWITCWRQSFADGCDVSDVPMVNLLVVVAFWVDQAPRKIVGACWSHCVSIYQKTWWFARGATYSSSIRSPDGILCNLTPAGHSPTVLESRSSSSLRVKPETLID